jgi:hypothetical protein
MDSVYKREPSFRIRYQFFTSEEGGRKQLPKQGWRAAFQYADEPIYPYYEIWPLFESSDGIILPELAEVPKSGTAQMFILHEEQKPFHRDRARPGVRCYLLEGGRLVAKAEII